MFILWACMFIKKQIKLRVLKNCFGKSREVFFLFRKVCKISRTIYYSDIP